MQIVTNRADIAVGQVLVAATIGATVGGSLVTQKKIAGEWSEGMLVDIAEEAASGEEVSRLTEELEDTQKQDDESDFDDASSSYQVLSGAARAADRSASTMPLPRGNIHHVTGDAAKAQYGKGFKVIAHVCNDRGRWGKGFVMAISSIWGTNPGKMYRKWHKAGATAGFALGAVQLVVLNDMLTVANMIGQNGIKTGSKGPPVRYEEIHEALELVCSHAAAKGASIHMPRIGSGLAGGEWQRLEAIVESVVERHGVDIFIYDYNG